MSDAGLLDARGKSGAPFLAAIRRAADRRFLSRQVISCAVALVALTHGAMANEQLAVALAHEQPRAAAVRIGSWTYAGTGTVNTYWIETPGGGLVVIDVQRDLIHAAQAIEAVRALGKPVRAILITHPHPDHYTGIGLFRQAFPGVVVYSSRATADTIRNDTFGASAGTQRDAPSVTPHEFVPPGETFDGDITLQIDGLTIIAREEGRGEAHSTTAYYLPATRDLFVGDAVLNHFHAPLLEAASASWLAILDRLETMFPNALVVYPGHGVSGPAQVLYEDERIYLRTCRVIAAEEIAKSGFSETAKRDAVRRINARFSYTNPTGIKDIVASSVDGLFEELSKPVGAPIPRVTILR